MSAQTGGGTLAAARPICLHAAGGGIENENDESQIIQVMT
jgi:hypothetical protein